MRESHRDQNALGVPQVELLDADVGKSPSLLILVPVLVTRLCM